VIVQAGVLNEAAQSTIVALVTGHLVDAPLLRLTLAPAPGNGLQKPSQVQVNRLLTVARVQGSHGVVSRSKARPWPKCAVVDHGQSV
jgi:hypothetical protein